MEIVSGRTGKPHVTSQQFRQMIEGTIGQESCIITSGENLEPELAANNLLKIRSGMMSHHGNVSSVNIGTYDEVELTNGSQGMKRIDLVVNRYTRNAETNIEKNEWVVIMGTPVASNPVAPTYTVGNLQKGDLVDDCPVFELHYDGINVTEVKKLLSVLPNVAELNSKMIPVFVSNPFQFVGTGNKTLKYTVSGNGYAFISLSGHIGCDTGNDFGQLEAKIWDKNHILLTMDRCVEATTFNYDFGVACSVMLPVQDGDVITGTISATKTGKKTILSNACCFGCQINITHD